MIAQLPDVLCSDCRNPLPADDVEVLVRIQRFEVELVPPVCSDCWCVKCGGTMLLGTIPCECAVIGGAA